MRVVFFIAGLILAFAALKFGALTYTLLADGQFFTTLLAAAFAAPCGFFGFFILWEAVD